MAANTTTITRKAAASTSPTSSARCSPNYPRPRGPLVDDAGRAQPGLGPAARHHRVLLDTGLRSGRLVLGFAQRLPARLDVDLRPEFGPLGEHRHLVGGHREESATYH